MQIAIALGVLLLASVPGNAKSADHSLATLIAAGGSSADRAAESEAHVRVRMVDRDSGDEDTVIVIVEIDAGFHINANPASFDWLNPTSLNVTNLTPLHVIYPQAVRFKPKFAADMLDVYQGTVRIVAEFSHGALSRTPSLFGTVTVQACTDVICLPPADLPLPQN